MILEDEVAVSGVASEVPFRPHCTLPRRRRSQVNHCDETGNFSGKVLVVL